MSKQNLTLEKVAREYISLCGEKTCSSDPSVGVQPCPFYSYESGCELRNYLGEAEGTNRRFTSKLRQYSELYEEDHTIDQLFHETGQLLKQAANLIDQLSARNMDSRPDPMQGKIHRIPVEYKGGESQYTPGKAVDYMFVKIDDDTVLYAEVEPGKTETATYESLRKAICRQAIENRIDPVLLRFFYDKR